MTQFSKQSHRLQTLLLISTVLLSASSAQSQLKREDVDVSKITEESRGSTLVLKIRTNKTEEDKTEREKSISLPLYDVNYHGLIANSPGPSFHVITGRACKDCLQDKAVYLLQEGQEKRALPFVLPGRIVNPKDQQTLFESRAFYGKCLPGYGEAYFVFQRERVDRRHGLQSSVFIAEPGPTLLKEKLIERRLPRIQHALRQVRAKHCWEVAGNKRMMLSKALDLTPRKGISDKEEDEEEEPKENQTQEELPSQPQEGAAAAAAPEPSPSPLVSPAP